MNLHDYPRYSEVKPGRYTKSKNGLLGQRCPSPFSGCRKAPTAPTSQTPFGIRVTGSPKFHSARRKRQVQHLTVNLRGFEKMISISGSTSCLCNSTMRRGQQDGYQQSGAPQRALFYTGGGNLRRREDETSPSPRTGEPMNVRRLDIDQRTNR